MSTLAFAGMEIFSLIRALANSDIADMVGTTGSVLAIAGNSRVKKLKKQTKFTFIMKRLACNARMHLYFYQVRS